MWYDIYSVWIERIPFLKQGSRWANERGSPVGEAGLLMAKKSTKDAKRKPKTQWRNCIR